MIPVVQSQTTTTVSYHYYADLAAGLCAGPIAAVRRAFADGNILKGDKVSEMRVYRGDEARHGSIDALSPCASRAGGAVRSRELDFRALHR